MSRSRTAPSTPAASRASPGAAEPTHLYVERPDLRIIDEDLWHAVHAMRKDDFPNVGKTGPRHQFILSSKIRCPDCGTILRVHRTRSKANSRAFSCPNDFGQDACPQRWRFDMGTLENIAVTEGLSERYLHQRSEFAAEAREAFVKAIEGQPRNRRKLEAERDQLHREIDRLTEKHALTGRVSTAKLNEMLDAREVRVAELMELLSDTPEAIPFPEDDALLQGMEGVLNILQKEAPFFPTSPVEYDVRDFLRKVIVSVDLRWTDGGRADVIVLYDMGKLHDLTVRIPITRTYHDRSVLYHQRVKAAAKQKTNQAAGAARFVLTDGEWATRPTMPTFEVACRALPCRGRRLMDAILLKAELDRPRNECMSANGTLLPTYERALDTVRMSPDIEPMRDWLEAIRPEVKSWDYLRIGRSKLPTQLMRFEGYPILALDQLSGSDRVSITEKQWLSIEASMARMPRYTFPRTKGFIAFLLELLRTGAETKPSAGSAYAAKAFGAWLTVFEKKGNLERLSRLLLAAEGKPTGPDKYPRLPSARTKRPDSKRALAAVAPGKA